MVKKATAAKKTTSSAKNPVASSDPPASPSTDVLSFKDQQRLLNVFSDAFRDVLSAEKFPAVLQEVKQALFNRDFAAAFGRRDYLEAYAARWSPTRALCYAVVFWGIRDHLNQVRSRGDQENPVAAGESTSGEAGGAAAAGYQSPVTDETDDPSPGSRPEAGNSINVLSIGGCAAEHVAFASYLHATASHGTLTLLDSAPWSDVTSLLQTQLTTPPTLSKYASASARAANTALVAPPQLSTTFTQHDTLSLDREALRGLVGGRPPIVTLMFTLNELYTNGGIGKTTKFLRSLGEVLPAESLLLVVDSPGSYSEAAVGKEKKRYPMQWLLNHTLVEKEAEAYWWERLETHDSVWFRLPEGLSYPIHLENMRYQMHLYRIRKNE